LASLCWFGDSAVEQDNFAYGAGRLRNPAFEIGRAGVRPRSANAGAGRNSGILEIPMRANRRFDHARNRKRSR
jgi:hypothetical protein